MNAGAPEFLFTTERALMTADAAGLVGDADIGIALTYNDFQSTSFDPATGTSTPITVDYAINALRNDLPAEEVQASNGLYQMGDVRLTFARSLLPIDPNKEDTIVIGSRTYNLINWHTDPISLLWRIVARVVA